MRDARLSSVPGTTTCSPARVQQLKLIAAARVSACRPTSRQQITDIVAVTVDNEVDTTTFAAIVDDVAGDALR